MMPSICYRWDPELLVVHSATGTLARARIGADGQEQQASSGLCTRSVLTMENCTATGKPVRGSVGDGLGTLQHPC